MHVFEFFLRYYAGSTKSYACFRILFTLLRYHADSTKSYVCFRILFTLLRYYAGSTKSYACFRILFTLLRSNKLFSPPFKYRRVKAFLNLRPSSIFTRL